MVALLIVSHSEDLAKGIKKLAEEMANEVKIEAVGGTSDGRLGNDFDKIYEALNSVYSEDGVIVLFDLGSSYLTAELVQETLELEGKNNIKIVDAALVEGAIVAAVEMSLDKSLDEICNKLSLLKLNKV